MRVDYFHTGGPKSGETIALDRVVNDGPWPGSRTQLVDRRTSASISSRCSTGERPVIYSRGFASIYGEWETTREAQDRRIERSTSRCASRGRSSPCRWC